MLQKNGSAGIMGFITIVILGILILFSIYVPRTSWKKHTAVISITYLFFLSTIFVVAYALYGNVSIQHQHIIIGSWFTILAIYIVIMTVLFELGFFKPKVILCNNNDTSTAKVPCQSPGRLICNADGTWICASPEENCLDPSQHWMYDPSNGSWTCQSCPDPYQWTYDPINQIWICQEPSSQLST